MRITYLHQYFKTPEMSGGIRSYEMARRLVSKGHEVNMVTSWRECDGKYRSFVTVEDGIRVHWLPVPYSKNMGYRDRIRSFLRFAWVASRKAASLPADVIFATSTPLTVALPGTFAARRQKVPLVFEVRDLWPDVPIAMGVLKNRLLIAIAHLLEHFAYRRSEKIVALTLTMRDFLSGKGVPLNRIAVIPNGADPAFFSSYTNNNVSASYQQFDVSNICHVVLYCGSLGPSHGPDYLVRMAEELYNQGSDIQIIVVGEGNMRDILENQAREGGYLNKTICFLGSKPYSEIPKFYAQADASIMTFFQYELLYRHSVQNKFFDSLAAGKPVFANYSGWSSEIAQQEGAGLILDNDVTKAANVLAHYLKDDSWLENAGKTARMLAENRFSWDQLAVQLEQVLASVVKERCK